MQISRLKDKQMRNATYLRWLSDITATLTEQQLLDAEYIDYEQLKKA
jgi:hypothetical protein